MSWIAALTFFCVSMFYGISEWHDHKTINFTTIGGLTMGVLLAFLSLHLKIAELSQDIAALRRQLTPV